ncbi:MAG: AAA family ATPase [Candidatus Hadarchaeales archaeon]
MTLWEEKITKDFQYENYLKKWGLSSDPFTTVLTSPEAFVPTQKEQLVRIKELLGEGKTGLLTGELGMGKTTVCEFLIAVLREENLLTADQSRHIIPVFIHTPAYHSMETLLKGLLLSLQLDTQFEPPQMFEVLKRWYLEHPEKLALIFDDLPQAPVSPSLLGEFLRVLSDLPQISLLLNGETEKMRRFLDKNPALKDRIHFHAKIRPMIEMEVRDMLIFRLKLGGCVDLNLFTPEAIRAVHRLSKGNPRRALRIASNSLKLAATFDSHVTSKIVKKANKKPFLASLLRRVEEF